MPCVSMTNARLSSRCSGMRPARSILASSEWATGDQRITQVWFAGCIPMSGEDIPTTRWRKVSLTWMMNEATAAGLNFKKPPKDGLNAVQQAASARTRMAGSMILRSGLGGYYRYGPRRVEELCDMVLSKNPEDKVRIRLPKIHKAFSGAHQRGSAPLCADRLSEEYASCRRWGSYEADWRSRGDRRQRDHRVAGQDATWNLVWKRRAISPSITVFASLHLVLFPFYRLTYPANELESQLRLVSDTIRLFGAFLPSGATRWLDAYAQDPAWFLVSAAWVAILILFGSSLGAQITDRMRRVWNKQSPAQSAAQ